MGALRDAAARQRIADLRATADSAERFINTSGHTLSKDQLDTAKADVHSWRRQADEAAQNKS
jgi:hypothetical protein